MGVGNLEEQSVPVRELTTDNSFENRLPTTDNYSAAGTVLKMERSRTEDTEDWEVKRSAYRRSSVNLSSLGV